MNLFLLERCFKYTLYGFQIFKMMKAVIIALVLVLACANPIMAGIGYGMGGMGMGGMGMGGMGMGMMYPGMMYGGYGGYGMMGMGMYGGYGGYGMMGMGYRMGGMMGYGYGKCKSTMPNETIRNN
jgi:hypothetical protein